MTDTPEEQLAHSLMEDLDAIAQKIEAARSKEHFGTVIDELLDDAKNSIRDLQHDYVGPLVQEAEEQAANTDEAIRERMAEDYSDAQRANWDKGCRT